MKFKDFHSLHKEKIAPGKLNRQDRFEGNCLEIGELNSTVTVARKILKLLRKYQRTLGRKLELRLVHSCMLIDTFQNQVPSPQSTKDRVVCGIRISSNIGIINLPVKMMIFSSELWRFLVLVNCFHWL